MTARVFGLTGGIGSGKSTVGRRFAERGLPLVNADELARAAIARGSAGFDEVVREFGPGVLDAAGDLDRKVLGRRVFREPAARARLEAIVHPRVRALARARFDALAARGEPLVCYEVPLLFEVGLDREYRPVVLVSAPEALQIERAAARDGSEPEEIRARVRAQLPLAEKAARSDHVIDNSKSLAETLAQADRVLDAICAELGVDAARYPRP